jgi:hypothetical protein
MSDNAIPTSLLVTNPGAAPATITLQGWRAAQIGQSAALTSLSSQVVPALGSARIQLPLRMPIPGAGYLPGQALRLISDAPVSAAHIQSDDSAETSTSSGGTMLLPVQALGSRYMAVTYPQVDEPKLVATAGSRGGAGQLIVVATEDDTTASFQAPAGVSIKAAGGAPNSTPGILFKFTMKEGDVYEILSTEAGSDLTGSEIISDKPVAVFSGNISTTYGRTAPGINSPDMAHEQLLPETSWGFSYVAAALPPQAGVCNGVLGMPDASLWRIVSARPGATVQFDAPPGVVGTPAATDSVPLVPGQPYELVVSGGSFTVTANQPVQVMQGMDCEPSLSSAINVSAPMLTDLRFAVLPNFDQLAAIVRRKGDEVDLDGSPIDDSMFADAGSMSMYQVAQVQLPTCTAAAGVCTHWLSGHFGVSIRGMDIVCSYALTVPTWHYCMDPDNPGCVP